MCRSAGSGGVRVCGSSGAGRARKGGIVKTWEEDPVAGGGGGREMGTRLQKPQQLFVVTT